MITRRTCAGRLYKLVSLVAVLGLLISGSPLALSPIQVVAGPGADVAQHAAAVPDDATPNGKGYYLNLQFVGNNEVFYTVSLNFYVWPYGYYDSGILYRNGSPIRSFGWREGGAWSVSEIFEDTGLAKGATYNYELQVFRGLTPQDPGSLIASESFSATTGGVYGNIYEDMTWTGDWQIVDDVFVHPGATLTIDQATIDDYTGGNAIFVDPQARIIVNGATIRDMYLVVSSNPSSITNTRFEGYCHVWSYYSDYEGTAALGNFEGNSGDGVLHVKMRVETSEPVRFVNNTGIDYFSLELSRSAAQVIVQNNEITRLDVFDMNCPFTGTVSILRNEIGTLEVRDLCYSGFAGTILIAENMMGGMRIDSVNVGDGKIEVVNNKGSTLYLENVSGRAVPADAVTASASAYSVVVRGNTFAGDLDSKGISLDTVSYVEISSNNTTGCDHGIWVDKHGGETGGLENSLIRDNAFGAWLTISSDGFMKNNTILNNTFAGASTLHCPSSTCPNTWNVPKTPGTNINGGPYLGGNCWGNYTGTDADGDGLGDTPYVFRGPAGNPSPGNVDNLPLMPGAYSYLGIDPFFLDVKQVIFSGGKYILPVDVTIRNGGCASVAVANVPVCFQDNGGWSETQVIPSIPAHGSASLHLDWDITSILMRGEGKANVQLTVSTSADSETHSIYVDARPRIIKVEPEYFPGWFMVGVSLWNKFEATIDWNGDLTDMGEDQAKDVFFGLGSLQAIEPANGQTKVAHTFDMGYDLGLGKNTLRIYARNVSNFDSDQTLIQMHQTPRPQWLRFHGTPGTWRVERCSQPGPDLAIYYSTFRFPDTTLDGAVDADGRAGPLQGRFGPSIRPWTLTLCQRSSGRGYVLGTSRVRAEVKDIRFVKKGPEPVSVRDPYGGRVAGETGVDRQDQVRLLDLWAHVQGEGRFKAPRWRVPQAPLVDVQLTGGADIGTFLEARENWASEEIRFEPDRSLDFKPTFEAVVTAGAETLSPARGAFGGQAQGEFQFFTAPYVRRASLRSYLRVSAGVLWFKKTQVWTWHWPTGSGQGSQEELWLVGETDWQPLSRDYGPQYAATVGASQGLTEAYPYADPAAVYLGAGRVLAAWVHDDTAKPQHQGLELRSALWDGLTWSAPLSTTNDLVVDFQPALAATPNGALAAWTRLHDAITGTVPTSPTQVYPQMEIAYAAYDAASGAWSAPQRLTDNGVMDFLPGAVGQDGKVMVVWLRDEDNAFPAFPDEATPLAEDLYYAVWDGASWAITPTLALDDVATREQPQFAYDGSRAVLAWSGDTDGVASTITDTEIFYATWNVTTTAWSAPQRLTTDAHADLSPRVVYDSAGVAHLLWVKEVPEADDPEPDDVVGRLYHAAWSNGSWSAPTLVLETEGIEELALTAAGQGNLVAVWRGVSDELSDLYHTVYDAGDGSWSQPALLTENRDVEWAYDAVYDDSRSQLFLVLTDQEVLTETVTVEFPATTTNDLLAQPGLAATETVTITLPAFGSSHLVHLAHAPAPDLVITTENIILTPTNPLPGQAANLSATVRNAGDRAASPVKVAFYDGDPAAGGALIGAVQTWPASLPGGLTATLSVSWTVPVSPAIHSLYVRADPFNEIAEANEGNNQAIRTAVLPDLVVDYAYATRQTAQKFKLTAHVSNVGGYPAAGVQAEYRLGAITGTLLGQTWPIPLPAGQSATFDLVWDISSTVPVTHTLYVLVDPANAVVEADEDNNADMLWVDILPDLTLAATDIGEEEPFDITIHNQGLVTATGVLVAVYQDYLTGTLLYSGTIAAIAPGGAGALPVALPPARYTLFVEIDPADAVPELDESNNLAMRNVVSHFRIYLPLVLKNY